MYRLWPYLLIILGIAGLFTGCGSSSSSSSSSSSYTPATAVEVSVRGSAYNIFSGQGITLTWSSTNATAIVSSNFGANALSGSVTLFPTTTTTYNIIVTGADIPATNQPTSNVTVTVIPPTSPCCVSGFGASKYTPGTGLLVQLTVTPAATTDSYTVTDTLPTGWTATNIGNRGTTTTTNNQVTVTWGPFTGIDTQCLSYTAVPPTGASGRVTFSGTAAFDGTQCHDHRRPDTRHSPRVSRK